MEPIKFTITEDNCISAEVVSNDNLYDCVFGVPSFNLLRVFMKDPDSVNEWTITNFDELDAETQYQLFKQIKHLKEEWQKLI